ncbi:MAG: RNA polymerase sigma factor [Patescibacteria group bacterium]|jgi:RNA polymerase sigma-70 factor (ECF subfamily)
MVESSDEELAQRSQDGDHLAFGVLVERYEKKLLSYGRRFLSQREEIADLVQEVFLKSYANLKSFDVTRRFSPWIYRIAHNVFVTALKKRKFEAVPFFDPDTLFPHPVAKETADGDAYEQELRAMLDKSLNQLDKKYREPLVLFYYQELDYEDIADILHIPVNTVGVRLKRGREAMRKMLEAEKK